MRSPTTRPGLRDRRAGQPLRPGRCRRSCRPTTSAPISARRCARQKPDLVSIATYSDSHADYAVAAMEAGAHVFVEKPLATRSRTPSGSLPRRRETGRKLVVGYILRHHPSWQRLIAEARGARAALRLPPQPQPAELGPTWEAHKALMQTTSPIVDCGVHYVDVMCQITDAAPVEVRGMGLRLTDEIAPDMYNYGHFQVLFADGSLGWYEAGWGPMMSDTAFFVKDVMLAERRGLDPACPRARGRTTSTRTRRTSLIRLAPGRRGRDEDLLDGRRARPPGALRPRGGLRRPGDRARISTSPATCRTPSPRSASASPRTRACGPACRSSSEDYRWARSHLVGITKSFGADRCDQGRRPRGRGRRVLRLRRPVGLRQVHAAPHHRRPRGRDRRRHPDRRASGSTRSPPADREIAMVFQTYALYPHLTVRDNMALGLQAGRRRQAPTIDERVANRVADAVARAAPRPPPGRALRRPAPARRHRPRHRARRRSSSSSTSRCRTSTPRCASHTRIEIARLHRELAATMIYVTHDQVEAMTLADRIVVLNAGRVEQVGAPMELYNDPANTFVAGFIGSPQMNFLDAGAARRRRARPSASAPSTRDQPRGRRDPRHHQPRRAPRRRDQRLRPAPSRTALGSPCRPLRRAPLRGSTRQCTCTPDPARAFHFDAEDAAYAPGPPRGCPSPAAVPARARAARANSSSDLRVTMRWAAAASNSSRSVSDRRWSASAAWSWATRSVTCEPRAPPLMRSKSQRMIPAEQEAPRPVW